MPNSYCAVPGCKSMKQKKPELSFHAFPKPGKERVYVQTKSGRKVVDRLLLWKKKLRIKRDILYYMKVCCEHFADSDYFNHRQGVAVKKRNLKRNAVPSKNLPTLADARRSREFRLKLQLRPKTIAKNIVRGKRIVLDPMPANQFAGIRKKALPESEEMVEEWLDDPLCPNTSKLNPEKHQPSSSFYSSPPNKIQGRRIIDLQYFFEKLQKIASHKTTPSCSMASLFILKEIYIGFNSDILIRCRSCNTNFTCPLSDPVLTVLPEVNRSAVAGSLATGLGYAGLSVFCDNLGIPNMTEEKFQEIVGDECKTEIGDSWNSGDEMDMPVEVFIKQECDIDEEQCYIDIKEEN